MKINIRSRLMLTLGFVGAIFMTSLSQPMASESPRIWKSVEGRVIHTYRVPISFNQPPTLAVVAEGLYFAIAGRESSTIFFIDRRGNMHAQQVDVPSLGEAFSWNGRACFVRYYADFFVCLTKSSTIEKIYLRYSTKRSPPQITLAFSKGPELYLVDFANHGVAHYAANDARFFTANGEIMSIGIDRRLTVVASFGSPLVAIDGLVEKHISIQSKRAVSVVFFQGRIVYADFLRQGIWTISHSGSQRSYQTQSLPSQLSVQNDTRVWFTGAGGINLRLGYFDGRSIREFSLPASLDPTAKIAVEKDGTIWLSDFRTHSIVELSLPHGKPPAPQP